MRILFLLPVTSQARYRKRIEALCGLGVRARVMAFERDYYPLKDGELSYERLGVVRHGAYLGRVPKLAKALLRVRRAVAECDAVYAFGLDMLLLAVAAAAGNRGVRMVYEVGDIGNFLRSGAGSVCVRTVERLLLKRVDRLVVTAEGYATEYYSPCQGWPASKTVVIENKLPAAVVNGVQRRQVVFAGGGGQRIRIGYFGVLRCERSWRVLKELAVRGEGKFEVVVRGFPVAPADIAEQARETPGMVYLGPYSAPSDLADIYAGVDAVWIAHYFHSPGSFSLARANRFYEAYCFGKPAIAQVGTRDALDVAADRTGILIDLADPIHAVERLLAMSHGDVAAWTRAVWDVPDNRYLYGSEHAQLLDALGTLGFGASGEHVRTT